jgi:hypothetical protein
MQIRNRFSGLIAATLIVAALFLILPAVVKGEDMEKLTGTWVVWVEPQPGIQIPLLQTFTSDGTVISSDSMGGLPGALVKMSPLHGVWKRTGPNTFNAMNLALVFDTNSGLFLGFGRTRAMLIVTGKKNEEGTASVYIEFLSCPSSFECPDPQDPDAAWVPYFPGAIEATATRLQLVPPPEF